jgi:hypothetical protein
LDFAFWNLVPTETCHHQRWRGRDGIWALEFGIFPDRAYALKRGVPIHMSVENYIENLF